MPKFEHVSVTRGSYATLILRATIGGTFVAHSLFKLVVLTFAGTEAFFTQQGFPGWTAYPVFAAELVGGVALILGIYTRVASVALVPVLLGAFIVHWPNGWYFGAPHGGWEYIAVLLGNVLALAILGDGRFAVATIVEKRILRARSVKDTPPHGSAGTVRSGAEHSQAWMFLYWALTLYVAATSLWAGVINVLHAPPLFDELLRLGYPAHFATLLGVWKVLGALALLAPGYALLKEWAYAGLFFDFSGALVAYAAAGDGAASYIGPLTSLAALITSWWLRPGSRRLASLSGYRRSSTCARAASRDAAVAQGTAA